MWEQPAVLEGAAVREGGPRVDSGLFPASSIARTLFAHPGARVIGALREAYMAALEPSSAHAIQGLSQYKADPLGRARRTMHWLDSVVFGTTKQASKASAAVRGKHSMVRGTEPVTRESYNLSTPFHGAGRARDRRLLTYGYVIIMGSFLVAYHQFCHPLSGEDQDRFLAEVATLSLQLGLELGDVPTSVDDVNTYYAEIGPQLALTPPGAIIFRDTVDLRRMNKSLWPIQPFYGLVVAQILSTLPEEFRLVVPSSVPRRLDPMLRRTAPMTGAALRLRPVRNAIDGTFHTPQSRDLFGAAFTAQLRR